MKTPLKRSGCPISYFTDIFGDKWTLVVLRDVLIVGKRHFKDLLKSEEGIASNILSDRLCRLECAGLITKSRDADKKNQYVYLPTEKCLELTNIIVEIAKWSVNQDKDSPVPAMAKKRGYSACSLFIEESIGEAIETNVALSTEV